MDTKSIRKALQEAELYIGDRSAMSAPFWDELHNAKAELESIAEAERDSRIHLRDTFAAAALTGLVFKYGTEWSEDQAARAAYFLADAMLKAREVR